LHLGGALIGGEDAAHQHETDDDRDQCSGGGEEQPEHLGAAERELLIPPFGC
jgi:hypothetical protein